MMQTPSDYTGIDLSNFSVNTPQTGSGMDWGSFKDGLLGSTNADGIKTPGWGGLGLGAANSLFNGWLGMKKLGVAEDELKENKRQFNMNWGAQKKTTNSELADRQRRRVSSGGGAQPVGQYMSKWGIQ